MGKYVVLLVVALWAMHLLLSRRASRNTTAAEAKVYRALGSTLRKIAIAVVGLIAALALILLVKHVTAAPTAHAVAVDAAVRMIGTLIFLRSFRFGAEAPTAMP